MSVLLLVVNAFPLCNNPPWVKKGVMIMRATWVLVLFLLSGCANPFVQFYKGTSGEDVAKSPAAVLPTGEPKLEQGTDRQKDQLRMLEDGYFPAGNSHFNAATIDKGEALAQAKAVHAEVVIVYQATVAPARGSQSARSEYLADYWVKLKPPVLGVHVRDLTTEIRINSGSKTGVYVIAVVKDSPASRAGIVRGDIVRKIGDGEINDSPGLLAAVAKLAGQKVMVEIWRDHQEVQKEVQLDQRK